MPTMAVEKRRHVALLHCGPSRSFVRSRGLMDEIRSSPTLDNADEGGSKERGETTIMRIRKYPILNVLAVPSASFSSGPN